MEDISRRPVSVRRPSESDECRTGLASVRPVSLAIATGRTNFSGYCQVRVRRQFDLCDSIITCPFTANGENEQSDKREARASSRSSAGFSFCSSKRNTREKTKRCRAFEKTMNGESEIGDAWIAEAWREVSPPLFTNRTNFAPL